MLQNDLPGAYALRMLLDDGHLEGLRIILQGSHPYLFQDDPEFTDILFHVLPESDRLEGLRVMLENSPTMLKSGSLVLGVLEMLPKKDHRPLGLMAILDKCPHVIQADHTVAAEIFLALPKANCTKVLSLILKRSASEMEMRGDFGNFGALALMFTNLRRLPAVNHLEVLRAILATRPNLMQTYYFQMRSIFRTLPFDNYRLEVLQVILQECPNVIQSEEELSQIYHELPEGNRREGLSIILKNKLLSVCTQYFNIIDNERRDSLNLVQGSFFVPPHPEQAEMNALRDDLRHNRMITVGELINRIIAMGDHDPNSLAYRLFSADPLLLQLVTSDLQVHRVDATV